MKKKYLFILLMLCMAICSGKINLSGKTEVNVVVGDEMTAQGQYWESVGIDFACEISDTLVVKLIDSKTKRLNPKSNMPGSDEGTKYLTFKAVKPGIITIKLYKDYRGEKKETKFITINVKENK